jgi:uncharacterized alkaline shock family protein YloU
MDDGEVHVRLHLIAAQDVSLMDLGKAIQAEVAQAVSEIIGLRVSAVDVYFEDVTA